MNIADGKSAIDAMLNNFDPFTSTKGCAFACHVSNLDEFGNPLNDGVTGAQTAKNLNIMIREERIKREVKRIGETILNKGKGRSNIYIHAFTWGVDWSSPQKRSLSHNSPHHRWRSKLN